MDGRNPVGRSDFGDLIFFDYDRPRGGRNPEPVFFFFAKVAIRRLPALDFSSFLVHERCCWLAGI